MDSAQPLSSLSQNIEYNSSYTTVDSSSSKKENPNPETLKVISKTKRGISLNFWLNHKVYTTI